MGAPSYTFGRKDEEIENAVIYSLQKSWVTKNDELNSFLKFLPDCIFLLFFRERVREKESKRNFDVREKHLSVASCRCPDQGSNPKPEYVP